MSSFLDFVKQDSQDKIVEHDHDVDNDSDHDNDSEHESDGDDHDSDHDVIEPSVVIKDPKDPKGIKRFNFNKNEKFVKTITDPKYANNNNFNEFFFKKGDFIKVIRPQRKYKIDDSGNIIILEKGTRLCDIYCGYMGEIRQFFKGDDKAKVLLHATNAPLQISLPIDCLTLLQKV